MAPVTNPQADYIAQLYRSILGREPESGAVEGWLAQNLAPTDLWRQIGGSPEAIHRLTSGQIGAQGTPGWSSYWGLADPNSPANQQFKQYLAGLPSQTAWMGAGGPEGFAAQILAGRQGAQGLRSDGGSVVRPPDNMYYPNAPAMSDLVGGMPLAMDGGRTAGSRDSTWDPFRGDRVGGGFNDTGTGTVPPPTGGGARNNVPPEYAWLGSLLGGSGGNVDLRGLAGLGAIGGGYRVPESPVAGDMNQLTGILTGALGGGFIPSALNAGRGFGSVLENALLGQIAGQGGGGTGRGIAATGGPGGALPGGAGGLFTQAQQYLAGGIPGGNNPLGGQVQDIGQFLLSRGLDFQGDLANQDQFNSNRFGANSLLFGQGPEPYGLTQQLNQIRTQGLPGQRAIEGLTGMAGQGQGLMNQAQQGIQGLSNAPLRQEAINAGWSNLNAPVRSTYGGDVGAGQANMGGAGQALGQQANRLFNTNYNFQQPGAVGQAESLASRLGNYQYGGPTVQQPGFFGDIISRAFGAGQGLQTPQVNVQEAQNPALSNYINQTLTTGLPAGFDDAFKRRVYEPQREALLGDLNRRGVLDSGQRLKEERDLFQQNFMDSLLLQQQEAQRGAAGLAQQGQQFSTDTAMRQGLANQAAALQTQNLGVGAGLQGLGLLPGLANQEVQRQVAQSQLGLDTGRFNAGNLSQAAGLLSGIGGQQAGLQQRGAELGLQATGLGANLLGQQAGIEADLARFNPQLQLQAAMANQGQRQQAGQADYARQLQQQQFGAGLQGQLFGQQAQQAGMLGDLGQNAVGNALGAFQGVSSANVPWAQMSGNLANQLNQQNLNTFDLLAGRGLQNLDTVARTSALPLQLQMQAAGQAGDLAQAMGQLGLGQQGMQQGALGQALQYLGQQQGHGLGQADLAASLVRSYLSGENQKAIAAMQTEAQRSMANRQALGQGIGSAGAIIGALLGGGGGGGGGYRTPPFFGFGGGGWGFDPFDPWFGFGGTLSSLGGY